MNTTLKISVLFAVAILLLVASVVLGGIFGAALLTIGIGLGTHAGVLATPGVSRPQKLQSS